jgi:hypothetical protein
MRHAVVNTLAALLVIGGVFLPSGAAVPAGGEEAGLIGFPRDFYAHGAAPSGSQARILPPRRGAE